MQFSNDAVEIIMESESFSAKSYLCPAQVWTIGWGHAILDGENFTEITKDEGKKLLIKDMQVAANCINENVKKSLSQNQFDALVSFVFNIGCGAFKKSTMLKLLNNEN